MDDVRNEGEQITAFVSLPEYAPGEQRRSGSAPRRQPRVLDLVPRTSVQPTAVRAAALVPVGAEPDEGKPSSKRATPP